MKKAIVFLLGICMCIQMSAQVDSRITQSIINTMNDFMGNIDLLYENDVDEMAEAINFSFGDETYFIYNKKDFESLKKWLDSFYVDQLDNEYIIHDLSINQNSIKKMVQDSNDLRYTFQATLKRKNNVYDPNTDYLIKDEILEIVVKYEKDRKVTILEMNGNWSINRIKPHYEWVYSLKAEPSIEKMPREGGKNWLTLKSTRQKYKKYGELKSEKVNGPEVVQVFVNDKNKSVDGNGRYPFDVIRNYSRLEKRHVYTVQQVADSDERYKDINPGNGLQTEKVIVIQEKGKINLEFFEFDENDAGYMDVRFHYGLNNTFGLSADYRFEDSRFTLGLYGAMDFDRIKHITTKTDYSYSENLGSVTNKVTTIIVDKNGQNITVEDYSERKIDVIYPSKRGYSFEVDPDGEAKYKKVYSYVMAMPGIYVNDWLHFDLGLGFARSQETYEVQDAYKIDVMERTYTKDGVTVTDTQNVIKRTGTSFLYKDKAKFNFAVRPGVNFYIPLSSWSERYLTLGAGYTYVPGDKDGNNLDFSIGYSFQF